jgi:hypothetical protein
MLGCHVCEIAMCACVSQPWEKDNVKLFYVWLFVGAGFMAWLMTTIVRKFKAAGIAVAAVLFVLMTLSGVLALLREPNSYHVMYGRDEAAVRAFFCRQWSPSPPSSRTVVVWRPFPLSSPLLSSPLLSSPLVCSLPHYRHRRMQRRWVSGCATTPELRP